MKVYPPAELRRFLAAMDRALERRAGVVIIGGAAAAIAYGVALGTRDVDTWTQVGEELASAAERARQRRDSAYRSRGAASRMGLTTSNRVWSARCRACGA